MLYSAPDVVLITIFDFCSIQDLASLSQTCKRFRFLVSRHRKWIPMAKESFVTNQLSPIMCQRSQHELSPFEKLRISYNWKQAKYIQCDPVRFWKKFMPQIHLERDLLWVSFGSAVHAYARSYGEVARTPVRVVDGRMTGTTDDVSRFIKTNNIITYIYGSYLYAYDLNLNDTIFCHYLLTKDSSLRDRLMGWHSLDANDDLLVASTNRTIEIWPFHAITSEYPQNESQCLAQIDDSLLSLKLNSTNKWLATSVRGRCIDIMDIETGSVIMNLGPAGLLNALDFHWIEHSHLLLSCGYDAKLSVWDTRSPNLSRGSEILPQLQYQDPFGSVLYCLSCDDKNTVLSGTQHHRRVNAYDLRANGIVQQVYFSEPRKQSAPIYSVSFDACQMFAASDEYVHMLDFTYDKAIARIYNVDLNKFIS